MDVHHLVIEECSHLANGWMPRFDIMLPSVLESYSLSLIPND